MLKRYKKKDDLRCGEMYYYDKGESGERCMDGKREDKIRYN